MELIFLKPEHKITQYYQNKCITKLQMNKVRVAGLINCITMAPIIFPSDAAITVQTLTGGTGHISRCRLTGVNSTAPLGVCLNRAFTTS